MGDFAENFIQGFMAGHRSKSEKERTALEKDRFAEAQKQHQDELKIRQQESDAMIQAHTLDEKLKLLAFQRSQPTPKEPVNTDVSGSRNEDLIGTGQPKVEAPVGLDFGGQHFDVPVVHQEEAQAADLAQTKAKAQALADVKSAPETLTDTTRKYLGLKPGEAASPTDIHVLVTKRTGEEATNRTLKAAEARAQAQFILQSTNRNPLRDEFGNFTGQLMDKRGNLYSNPELEGLRDRPLTGQVASRVHQAAVVQDTGNMVLDHLGDASLSSKLGPIMGRKFKLEDLIGNPDPEVKRFATELASFAALQPALHGFRGQNALREFEKIIGDAKNTPESLAAGIQGILDVGGVIAKSAAPSAGVERPKGGAGKPKTAADYLAKIGG